MRTPLLPFDEFLHWSDGLAASDADPEELPGALDADRARLRTRLREFVSRPEVREAIFVASPVADGLVDGWLANESASAGIERALVRYLARMTGRCTPFGLFAGVSVGSIGPVTRLEVGPRSEYRRSTRLDAAYLGDVLAGTLAEPASRAAASFRANPTLYRSGGRWRFVRSQPGAEEGRHLLTSVKDSHALALALEAAAVPATPSAIASALKSTGAGSDRIAQFIDDLIEQQVVVPALELKVTGADAVYGLGCIGALERAGAELASLDAGGVGQAQARYRAVSGSLAELPAKMDEGKLFQVDLFKDSPGATIGEVVVAEVLRGAELLHAISAPPPQETVLSRFISQFVERFEGRAVPLLEALDPDSGVPFDDEGGATVLILVGLGTPADTESAWTMREELLLKKAMFAQATGAPEIVLTQQDVEALQRAGRQPLPDAIGVMASIAATTPADLDRGNFRVFIAGLDGPSGARLLGRFCHLDEGLREAVDEHLRAEEALDPSAIFAEIVHLPRARDVNVAARPALREHEILCIGGSGGSATGQIPLSDLLVSVEGEEVVLRSRSKGKRVVPRLTSAHNFASRGVSFYRFLCHLQQQGHEPGGGFWGALDGAPALPRVRHGRAILALARWRLFAETFAGKSDPAAGFAALREWRRLWRVPRLVAQTEFGGQLPIDLENVLCVESLAEDVRSRGFVDLVELFPGPDERCVWSDEGAFVHEMIIPFVREKAQQRRATASTYDAGAVARIVPPGGEWLYARLYTGETAADQLLLDVVAPFAARVLENGDADSWFFMRYVDPRYHLRVRFHGDPTVLHGRVLPALQDAAAEALEGGLLWRIEFGTYHREVERYGGPEAIGLAESFFRADSDAVASLLSALEAGEAGQEERWMLGLAGTNALLIDLGLDPPARLALMRSQRTALARQLGWDAAALGKVGDLFRKHRRDLESLLAARPGDGHPLGPGLEILHERSVRAAAAMTGYRDLDRSGRLSLPLPDVASSLVHMHLNRLVRGSNVPQELVICDFLARLYEGQARRRDRP